MSSKSAIVDERFCFEEETLLTVHKTSIFIPGGDGFIVYNPTGEIIFRVDSYGPEYDSRDELVLMDSTGKSLVTLHRKKPSLHQRWEGFIGEKKEEQEPQFSIFKSSIIGQFHLVAEVYGDPSKEYQIKGSLLKDRAPSTLLIPSSDSCELKEPEPVAEIKRKVDPDTNVILGKDVFLICLRPGTDGAFVMALVLILDRMGGFDVDGDDGNQLHAFAEGVSS